jgi:hypothetical protein
MYVLIYIQTNNVAVIFVTISKVLFKFLFIRICPEGQQWDVKLKANASRARFCRTPFLFQP